MSKGTRGEVAEEQQTMTYDEKTWNAAISAAAKVIRETDEKGSRGYGALLDRLEERILSLPCPGAPATGGTRPWCRGSGWTSSAACLRDRVKCGGCPDCAPPSTAPGDEAGVCATCGGSGQHGTKSHGYGEEPMKCHDCAGTGRLMDSGPPDHWGATCAVCGGSGRYVIAIDEPSCACETCGGTGRAASGGGR